MPVKPKRVNPLLSKIEVGKPRESVLQLPPSFTPDHIYGVASKRSGKASLPLPFTVLLQPNLGSLHFLPFAVLLQPNLYRAITTKPPRFIHQQITLKRMHAMSCAGCIV